MQEWVFFPNMLVMPCHTAYKFKYRHCQKIISLRTIKVNIQWDCKNEIPYTHLPTQSSSNFITKNKNEIFTLNFRFALKNTCRQKAVGKCSILNQPQYFPQAEKYQNGSESLISALGKRVQNSWELSSQSRSNEYFTQNMKKGMLGMFLWFFCVVWFVSRFEI